MLSLGKKSSSFFNSLAKPPILLKNSLKYIQQNNYILENESKKCTDLRKIKPKP